MIDSEELARQRVTVRTMGTFVGVEREMEVGEMVAVIYIEGLRPWSDIDATYCGGG